MNGQLPLWARFLVPPVFLVGGYVSLLLCFPFIFALMFGGAVQGIYYMAGLVFAAIALVVCAGFVAFKGTVGWAYAGSIALVPGICFWITLGHQLR